MQASQISGGKEQALEAWPAVLGRRLCIVRETEAEADANLKRAQAFLLRTASDSGMLRADVPKIPETEGEAA